MSEAARVAADRPESGPSSPDQAGVAGAADAAGDSAEALPAPDPYEGLDDVTRAKQRLLEYGRQHDAECRSNRAMWVMARPMCAVAVGAFAVGLVCGFMPKLRRWVTRNVVKGVKRMLLRSPPRRSSNTRRHRKSRCWRG